MTTAMDELRDVQAAALSGKSLGDYRRSRTSRRDVSIIVTPPGTRVAKPKIRRESGLSQSHVTGEGVVVNPALGLLRATTFEGTPTIGLPVGFRQSSGFVRTNWATVISDAVDWIPAMIVETAALSTSERSAGLSFLAASALRSWHAARGSGGQSRNQTSRRHAGISAIKWVCGYLDISQDRALRIGHVSPATFYSWIAKPDTAVRPKTVEHLLRVTASLKLLEAALKSKDSRYVLTAGSPSLLDRLAGDTASAETALRLVADRVEPRRVTPPRRVTDPGSILAQLEQLDVISEATEDPNPLGPAISLDEGDADLRGDEANESEK